MLRAAQDSFYTHVIPYLLWDDFLHFSNNNRAVLRLVDKRAYTAVSRWVLPSDKLIALVSRYFPLHDEPVSNWQHTTALQIVTEMILYSPKKWVICVPRRLGSTTFLIQFARMIRIPTQLIVNGLRAVEHIGNVSPNCIVRSWGEALLLFEGVVLYDNSPDMNLPRKTAHIKVTSENVIMHLPHMKVIKINVH